MKKSLFLLISILLISAGFYSCEKANTQKEFSPEKSFSVHMQAQKDKKQFEADIKCLSAEEIILSFTFPKELSGFTVTTVKDGYLVNVFGVTDEVSAEDIKESALINILTQAIKISVYKNHGLFVTDEKNTRAEITVDGIPVSVTFTNDGIISEIRAETIGFFALFQKSG